MKKQTLLWIGYGLLFCFYALFSYSLTAPNLILSSWPPFWKFQTYMWKTFFNNRQLLAQTYLILISAIFLIYGLLLKQIKTLPQKTSLTKILLLIIVISFPLLLANNALSYDVFNYIFNAKMVVVFKTNPHVDVALNYSYDDWTRFMHNLHTPAPYGYGWTALSLLPYLMGLGRFLLVWTSFRVFSLLSLLLLILCYWWLFKVEKNKNIFQKMLPVVINPLVLLEVISNSHNDLWMMVPALLSLGIVAGIARAKKKYWLLVSSVLLLLFSISIKLATILLIPLWGLLVFGWLYKKKFPLWPLLASLLMFLPLLTLRSQQFHPWYLTWVLVWVPLFPKIKISQLWSSAILILSFSSMLRYIPFLAAGEYTESVLLHQKAISWTPFVLTLAFVSLKLLSKNKVK